MERRNVLCWGLGTCVLSAVLSLPLAAQSAPSAGYALENGDVNGDQERDLSDPVYLLSHLFLGGPIAVPLAYCDADVPVVQNGDSNHDGAIDLSDSVHLLGWLFVGGPEPADACILGNGEGAHENPHRCGNRVAPPHSQAHGKTLQEWLTIYWTWYFGTNADPAQSKVGRVQLMPLPAPDTVTGSFTPDDPGVITGAIDVTLPPGTPFVIPQFAWTRETYDPNLDPLIPDDPAIPDDSLLAAVSPNLSIDGCTVVNDENERRFYIPPTPIDPTIFYPEPTSYGSIGIIGFQGCGIVALPLSPGVHVMKIDLPWILRDPPPGISPFGVIYHNTWNITVQP